MINHSKTLILGIAIYYPIIIGNLNNFIMKMELLFIIHPFVSFPSQMLNRYYIHFS